MRRIFPIVLAVCGLWLSLAGTAEAQRWSRSWQQRPLTLPRGTLQLRLAQHEPTFPDQKGVWFQRNPGPIDNVFALTGGVDGGITPNFQIGATVLPLLLAPDIEYLNPNVYVRYRFLGREVEIAVEGGAIFPAQDGDDTVDIWMGIPFLIHAGDILRIDTGMFVFTDFDFVNGWIPATFAFQATGDFFLGFDTGLKFGDGVADDPNVPLGFFVGLTTGRPTVDMRFGARFPAVDETTEVWQLWSAFNFYLYL